MSILSMQFKAVKKSIILLALSLLMTPFVAFAEENISRDAFNQVGGNLEVIIDSVNSGETQNILNLISPNANLALKDEILEKLGGGKILLGEHISYCDYLSENKIKVKGRFNAKGVGWEVTGLSNYFIFEKYNGNWLLLETNFHKKIGAGYVFKIIGVIMLILVPLGLFWLWMLIDCANRAIDNKTAWILIIIFLSILGAALYFFIPRRKYKKEQKYRSEIYSKEEMQE